MTLNDGRPRVKASKDLWGAGRNVTIETHPALLQKRIFALNHKKIVTTVFIASFIALLVGGTLAVLSEKGTKKQAAPAEAGSQKRALHIGFDTRPRSFDPRLIGGDASSQYLEELRFLPLVSFDSLGKVRMVLAEQVESADNKIWKVTLKKGVRFGNQQEIQASDVVATYQAIQDGQARPPSPRRGAFEKIRTLTAVGPYAILIELASADAAFINNLVVGIIPASLTEIPRETGLPGGFESGPFLLTTSSDEEVTLHRNPQYSWKEVGETEPQVDEIRFHIIPDNHTRYLAVLKGDLDILQNGLDSDKLVALSQRLPHLKILQTPALNTTSLGLRVTDPLLSDLSVRKCIEGSIHKEIILKYTLQNKGEIAHGMFPSISDFYYGKHIGAISEFHPEKCRSIFANAAQKKGPEKNSALTIFVTTNRERIAIARALAAQLADAGLPTEVQALEAATFSDQLSKGLVQAWIAPWTGFKDGDHLRYAFHSAMIPPRGGNRSHYKNPSVDALLEEALAESNKEKRIQKYNAAEEIILSDLPYVYLWHRYNVTILHPRVTGFTPYADGRYWSVGQVALRPE